MTHYIYQNSVEFDWSQLKEDCDKTDVFTWNMGLVIPEVFIRINMSTSQPETLENTIMINLGDCASGSVGACSVEEPCTPAAYVQRVQEERDRLVGQCQEAERYLNYWNLPAHVLEQVRVAVGKSKLITSHAKSPLARFEELCREAMMLGGNKPLGWDPGYRLSLMLAYDGNPTAFGDGADEDLVRYDNRVTVYKSKEKRADVFWATQARGVGRQLV
ncbi:hypothetical protein Bbelb_049800 [Branchiostoma belcheri]|nr:hypothetical protein Bbelb_049800 [Branchiostoma belcheri]